MRCYIVQWYTTPDGAPKCEYFKYELMAISRQKELENIGKMLKIDGWFSVQLGEILVKE